VLWEKRLTQKKRNIKKATRKRRKRFVAKNTKRAKGVKIARLLNQLPPVSYYTNFSKI